MEIKIEKTSAPKIKPDDATLSFGKYFTDHMFIMDYKEENWQNARIIPYGPILLEPSAMVLHYGQAVFEGLKAYRADDGRILLFRANKNIERLNASDERLCIPHIDEEIALTALHKLIQTDADWVPKSKDTTLYIRPFTFADEGALGVHPSANYKFVIILSPVGPYYAEGLNPVKIFVEDEYVRAVRGGVGFTKATANYAASLKGQIKAKELGFTQALWLDAIERKYIEEVGTMNIFFKIGGEFVTPSLTGSILPGVTRDSVITLLNDWGFSVVERRIDINEIFEAHDNGTLEEAFGTGTAAVISPIGGMFMNNKNITINGGETGEYSKKLYDALTDIQFGRAEDKFGWVTEVMI